MKKLKIKRNIRLGLIVILPIIVIGLVLYKTNIYDKDIDRVLKTDAYNYLNSNALNYIKKVYEETGEIILTEKNKKENTPYLNPQYVTYLQLSNKQKESVSIIPTPYSVDYVFLGENSGKEFPKSYNLENVDGKNYTSPMYNQGSLGTCWAFATIENAESHLMIKNNEPQNENSTRFSVRQLDYAASTNGIKGYKNPYGAAGLGLGGNFIYATTLMANGLSLVNNSYMPYVETLNEKPLHEIHNYSNSLYEVNGTVNLPSFGRVGWNIARECSSSSDDVNTCYAEKIEEARQEYINIIKEGITNYGGIYVGTNDPTGKCGALNTDGYYILDPTQTCFPAGSTDSVETGHAMQIIGWNDDYEYSYCKNSTYSSTINGVCESGILTQGTGAWLVKNSWGEDNAASYIYLTYDAIQSNFVDFAYITSLTEMKDKNWDNVYNNGLISNKISKKLTQTFEKKHVNQEKIQKIKFHTTLMNQQYSISVQMGKNTYSITDSYQTKYPGLYTVDVSDKNIILETGNFDVTISCSNQSINNNSISIFTKNVDNEQLIVTEEEKDIDSNNFMIYSETRNITSNSQIAYELYNDTEKIENVMQVNNNIVSANNINTEISLIKKLNPGTYRLVQKIGNVEATTSLNIGNILDGAGTIDNPYQIYTEEDLKYIHNHLDFHYELENDIELTEEWVPIGTNENPFTGSFNGKNHKIINLQINDSTLEYAGLFGYVKDSDEHKTQIKNIYLVNPNIVAKQYVGGLIGGININQTGENTALIDSIYIMGGSIEGEFANGLVADISGYKNLTINNIFSSATIKGKSHSSLIRFSSNKYNSNEGTSISNIQNIGIMLDNNLSYYKTSLISTNYSFYYNISNYISTGYSKKVVSLNQFYDTPIHDIDHYYYSSNGYALSRTSSIYKFPEIIKKISNITELKNIDKYNNWGEDFNLYWKIDEIDGIKRIPILKGVDLDYTDSINDINIELGNDISLSDYISSEIITRRLKVTTDNDDIINISEKYNNSEADPYEIIIKPLKSGTATIHVISDYDGFEQDVNITVYKTKLKITYHNDSDTVEQTITQGTTINLTKNTFEKEGHTFVGWNTKADGTGTSYADEQEVTITDDLDLYAQWQPLEYKIKFDANGGEGTMDDFVLIYGESKSLPSNSFIKAGYYFGHWNTKADNSGVSYYDRKVVSLNDNLKLYAIWYPIYYGTLWYNEDQTKIANGTNKYDVEYTIDGYKWALKEGYTFKEWNTEPDGSGTSYREGDKFKNLTTVNNSIIRFYAIVLPINYEISFDANGGTGTMNHEILTYDSESNLTKNTFTREGYTFKEWNTKADGSGTSYNNEQNVKNLSSMENAIVDLYAQWQPIKYKIKFYANGGTGAPREQEVQYDKVTSLDKNTFTKSGYLFKEWNTELDGSGTSYSDEQEILNLSNSTNQIIELYAQWQPIKYKIKFYANGGTGAPREQEVQYDKVTSLDKNTFTKSGYLFKEWNTELDGSGTSYSDEQEILNLSNSTNQIIELYAQWQESIDYVINNYDVDETNKYISKIMVNTEVNNFVSNIILGYGYGIDVDTKTINNKQLLYTGGKTRITHGLDLYREYTNIVIGDINGDGAINSADLLKIRQHLLGTNILTGAYFLSSDINYDSTINSADLLRVRQHLLGTKPIE